MAVSLAENLSSLEEATAISLPRARAELIGAILQT